MLLGQMPGDALSRPPALFAALPSYATLIGRYLDRFGPYRLQPYAMPPAPRDPQRNMPVAPPVPGTQPISPVPAYGVPIYREARGAATRKSPAPVDPVGAGPGVLTGYDRVLDFVDGVVNPLGLGTGFSNPTGMGLAALGVRELADMARRGVVDKINAARRQGLINDANVRVRRGTPVGRAGGVGTAGIGGGSTKAPAKSEKPDRAPKDSGWNRGLGSRGRGFNHFGGPR